MDWPGLGRWEDKPPGEPVSERRFGMSLALSSAGSAPIGVVKLLGC